MMAENHRSVTLRFLASRRLAHRKRNTRPTRNRKEQQTDATGGGRRQPQRGPEFSRHQLRPPRLAGHVICSHELQRCGSAVFDMADAHQVFAHCPYVTDRDSDSSQH